ARGCGKDSLFHRVCSDSLTPWLGSNTRWTSCARSLIGMRLHACSRSTKMINLWKPWYVCRPVQVPLRIVRALRRPRTGFQRLQVTWGASLLADPTKTIGRSIRTTGIYDIGVSELLARLIRPGDTTIDVGANVGYMTLLMGALAGKT